VKDILLRVEGNDTIVIANKNTTIGYATFNTVSYELTYIFVSPLFRRQGYGYLLIKTAEKVAKKKLRPLPPISPLGEFLFKSVK